jgi:dihydropteroate synthase
MHMRGTPRTMQQLPPVQEIISAVRRGLTASVRRALAAGIGKRSIVVDPGIGFGKTAEQNFELLGKGLAQLARLGYPILVGPSRKSFIRRSVENSRESRDIKRSEALPGTDEVLFGTAAAVAAAILNGAHIVRVHDVRQMLSVARVADCLPGL